MRTECIDAYARAPAVQPSAGPRPGGPRRGETAGWGTADHGPSTPPPWWDGKEVTRRRLAFFFFSLPTFSVPPVRVYATNTGAVCVRVRIYYYIYIL